LENNESVENKFRNEDVDLENQEYPNIFEEIDQNEMSRGGK